VKDLFDTAGIRTTYGSAVFGEHVPGRSARAVTLLEAAGYANIGKTNLHEFAYGVTSQNLHYGTVPNPWYPGRTAGGSSGGSAAALTAGLADAALGTDTGGSIRIPAACCGIAGFKPTFGLVSLEGVFPLAPSFDHAGPLALDVSTCVELMRLLAPGFEPEEPRPLGSVRAAVAWTGEANPLVAARVEEAAGLFPDLRHVDFPRADATLPAFQREIADVHRELYEENAELYGENIRPKVERCLEITEAEAAGAQAARDEHRRQALGALGDVDVLLTPTLPHVALPADVDEIARRDEIVRFTYAFNSLGWPVLALPCGPAENGQPASIQIAGRPGADPLVLAVGMALERALKRKGPSAEI
jgi:aspartyl-tRNA(Asn)/glutamyl-tRNA(Gln) amidotransferase subunit A